MFEELRYVLWSYATRAWVILIAYNSWVYFLLEL